MDHTVVLVLKKRRDEGALPHASRPQEDQRDEIRSVGMGRRA